MPKISIDIKSKTQRAVSGGMLNRKGRITGLLHNLQKLNDHFRAGAHKHLTLAALLSVGDAL